MTHPNKQSPKNFSDRISTPKLARQRPKKKENDLQKQEEIKKSKNKSFKNESYQFTLVNPKKLLRPHPDQKRYLDRAPKGSKLAQKKKNLKNQKTNKSCKMKVINHKKVSK